MQVLQMQIQPTAPDPAACQTNMRTIYVSANLDDQQWGSTCPSTHRTGAFAHYYTFDLRDTRDVNIRVTSSTDALYVYLLSGVDQAGRILMQSNSLSSVGTEGSNGYAEAGFQDRLVAGTYTLEVTRQQPGWSSGAFSLAMQAALPAPTPAVPTLR